MAAASNMRNIRQIPTRDLRSAESFNAFFEEGWHAQDVRASRGVEYYRRRNGQVGFFSDTMLFTADEMKRSDYYEGFGRRHDVPWFAAAPIYGGATEVQKNIIWKTISRSFA